ncbi:hypothetical protein AU210_011883 [Fusarium oxysporum f. sp. radicis-cucumerinum]|uniref:Uncharacterized protein n=2 Tax=Fusarium oxysporum TaxID=5507 RepID=A0A2H3GFG7_FUSOX|nr:hypothetical protein AU210_011883 [Fusarium oxysporum f. sp. radicis-cucumerinum]RKK95763.1 hypothetical protein BFJ71_g8229 [Fusarium oxysporum]RKL24471.1 hypothetical protein BFJ68_g474 [Fusarium oxysporum]
MGVQLTIVVAALSVLIRLIAIYAIPFLGRTGDPEAHALLILAQYPIPLLYELLMLDNPVPAIPSDMRPIVRFFYYLFHKQCIILYLQDLAIRFTVNGILALQKRSWSPFVNTSRPLDKMTRKQIAKIVIFDEVMLWALTAFHISDRTYRDQSAWDRVQFRLEYAME